MKNLLTKIVDHQLNEKLLIFLTVDLKKNGLYLEKWADIRCAFNEGGCVFFDEYGKEVPENCKYCFETHHIMVHPLSGEIFAFHTGRFSIFFRCDFERSNLINLAGYRKGYTFDCISDITELGENWTFLKADFEDEIEEQFKWAYEKVKTKYESTGEG